MDLVIGTNLYQAEGDALFRQELASQSITTLSDIRAVNLQFLDKRSMFEYEGLETVCVLRQDSTTVTRSTGPRKPITLEVFDALARKAIDYDARYFAFCNSDIVWTQQAVDYIYEHSKQSYSFSRMDFDSSTGQDLEMIIWGVDAFACDARWWLQNRHGFRPYIIGESCWDNVYATRLMCLSDGHICNWNAMLRHARHEAQWNNGPFASYNGYLAALDAPLFSIWCQYIANLEQYRASPIDHRDEMHLQQTVFQWSPAIRSSVVHAARGIKARLSYHCRHFFRMHRRASALLRPSGVP